jgi:hypothetical protein
METKMRGTLPNEDEVLWCMGTKCAKQNKV